MPNPFLVLVTDRRLVYTCDRFTKGSTWVPFGVAGAVLAGTAMAISAAKARKARQGRAAAGQLRYDWLSVATWQFPAGKPPHAQLVVTSPGLSLCLDVSFLSVPPITHDTARYVMAVAAHHRLTHAVGLDADSTSKLTGLAQQTDNTISSPTIFKSGLPGAVMLPNRLGRPGGQIAAIGTSAASTPLPDGPSSNARWAADPYGRHELRYYDGQQWTEHVSNSGHTGVDPLPADATNPQT